MTDLDLSRDTYAVVSAGRMQFDQLVWQVQVFSLTAQAIRFSIALSPDVKVASWRSKNPRDLRLFKELDLGKTQLAVWARNYDHVVVRVDEH